MRYGWRPYVPVHARRAQARRKMDRLRKRGVDIQPVEIEGRKIARTFWGEAWCDHLESFSDFENRLPRGRTYVRNGSVCHLAIAKGDVKAMVSGSELYNVQVTIKTLGAKRWGGLQRRCAGQIGSLLELLQGRLSNQVMALVTDRKDGLFPLPREIELACDCPDWATMCKHVAAVLYGVGARLDERPELLFLLRGVDHTQLVSEDAAKSITAGTPGAGRLALDADGLSGMFGIELDAAAAPAGAGAKKPSRKQATFRPSAHRAAKVVKKLVKKTRKKTQKKAAKRSAKKTGAKSSPGSAKGTGGESPRAASPGIIRKLRARLGLTQEKLAALIGVSAGAVALWEQGRSSPSPANRDAIVALRPSSRRQAQHMLEAKQRKAARTAKKTGEKARPRKKKAR